jgi:hypothetical protein
MSGLRIIGFGAGVPTGIRTPVTVTRFYGQEFMLRLNEF